MNRANAIVGYGLGGVLSLALMIVGGALFLAARDRARAPRHDRSRRRGAARPDRAAARAPRHPVRRRRSVDRHASSPAPTTSPSSAAGSGAATGSQRARRASRSRGSCSSSSRSAIVMTGVDPVDADGVRGHLLGRRAAADVPPDLARRERQAPTWAATRNGRLANVARDRLLRDHLGISLSAIPLMILTNVGQN